MLPSLDGNLPECVLRTTREQVSIDSVHYIFAIVKLSWVSIIQSIRFNHKCGVDPVDRRSGRVETEGSRDRRSAKVREIAGPGDRRSARSKVRETETLHKNYENSFLSSFFLFHCLSLLYCIFPISSL